MSEVTVDLLGELLSGARRLDDVALDRAVAALAPAQRMALVDRLRELHELARLMAEVPLIGSRRAA